jgi:hypothetical protein
MGGHVIALRVVDPFPPLAVRVPGMMWRYAEGDKEGRECWWIELPQDHPDLGTPGHPGRISWRTTDRASDPPHEMWTVTGTPPALTVTPSIDVLRYVRKGDESVHEGSYWHGFITAGEIVG